MEKINTYFLQLVRDKKDNCFDYVKKMKELIENKLSQGNGVQLLFNIFDSEKVLQTIYLDFDKLESIFGKIRNKDLLGANEEINKVWLWIQNQSAYVEVNQSIELINFGSQKYGKNKEIHHNKLSDLTSI